jgi:hypothetical protein
MATSQTARSITQKHLAPQRASRAFRIPWLCVSLQQTFWSQAEIHHKVLYYTQNGLGNGAAFTESGIVWAGPVGPGTLSTDPYARRLPSWYLTEEAALTKKQPHQSLCSTNSNSSHRPRAKIKCLDIAPKTPSYSNSDATADEETAGQKQSTSPAEPRASQSSPVTRSPAASKTVQQTPETTPNGEISGDCDGSISASQKGQILSHEVCLQRIMAESVRKAIFSSAYSGPEVASDAHLHPRPFLRATRAEAVFRRLTRWSIASSHVSIRFVGNVKYSVVEDGADYRYYGRGPEWHSNSCFWDLIMVSCMFLNGDFTYLDRGTSPRDWESALTNIQRAFLDVLRMDWDFFDTKTSIAQRNVSKPFPP